MVSQNVAMWDINIALWAIFLFIVTRIFHFWKMIYLTFNWHNSATSWIFMRFSAKRFALAALSVYYNYTEIVKTLSGSLTRNRVGGLSVCTILFLKPGYQKDRIEVLRNARNSCFFLFLFLFFFFFVFLFVLLFCFVCFLFCFVFVVIFCFCFCCCCFCQRLNFSKKKKKKWKLFFQLKMFFIRSEILHWNPIQCIRTVVNQIYAFKIFLYDVCMGLILSKGEMTVCASYVQFSEDQNIVFKPWSAIV